MSEPRVVHGENRYELWLGDERVGLAEYTSADHRTVFTHTEIDPRFGGRGLGSTLIAAAVADTARKGHRIVPQCSFVAAYLRQHPDAAPDVEWH